MKYKFFICELGLKEMWNEYGVFFSEKFCHFFSDSVADIIMSETGLSASSKLSLSSFRQNNDLPTYEKGIISVIRTRISILPEFHDNINFFWKSKTGRIVETTDKDFDENDLECWIEGLKPALYWKQVSKEKEDYPFKVKDLPFPVKVLGFGTHMGIEVKVPDALSNAEIINAVNSLVEKHNHVSELKERQAGVVHNLSARVENGSICFRIDNGSAGIMFVKKILKLLAMFSTVTEVILDL